MTLTENKKGPSSADYRTPSALFGLGCAGEMIGVALSVVGLVTLVMFGGLFPLLTFVGGGGLLAVSSGVILISLPGKPLWKGEMDSINL
jgi:hypothetical protein